MRTVLVGGAMCKDVDIVDVHIADIGGVFAALAQLGYDGCCADPGSERRRLQAAGMAVGASEQQAEGSELCLLSTRWEDEWREKLADWFRGLPLPTQEQLGGCMGALALHLGSRLDALLGRASPSAKGPTATTRGSAGPSTSEAGCEWLHEGSPLQTLPDFPEPPARFEVPPLPRLLPSWGQQLHSRAQPRAPHGEGSMKESGERSVQQEARHSQTAWVGAVYGAGAGALAALAMVVFVGVARRASVFRASKRPALRRQR